MEASTTTQVTLQTCGYCRMFHTGSCPKVRVLEYYPNGTLKRMEFFDEVPPPVPNPIPYAPPWTYRFTCSEGTFYTPPGLKYTVWNS